MSLSIIFQASIVSLWFNVTFNNFSGINMPEKLLKVTLNHKETIFSSEQLGFTLWAGSSVVTYFGQ